MITLPTLRHFIDRSQESVLQKQVAETLMFAKQAAVASRTPIAVCMSNNTSQCDNGNRYLLVFKDAFHDANLHDKKQLVTITSIALQNSQLHLRSFPLYRAAMLFLPTNNERADNGTWWYCNHDSPRWAIVVTAFGEVRLLNQKQVGYLHC